MSAKGSLGLSESSSTVNKSSPTTGAITSMMNGLTLNSSDNCSLTSGTDLPPHLMDSSPNMGVTDSSLLEYPMDSIESVRDSEESLSMLRESLAALTNRHSKREEPQYSTVLSDHLQINFNSEPAPVANIYFNEFGASFSLSIPPFSPHYSNCLLLESLLNDYVGGLLQKELTCIKDQQKDPAKLSPKMSKN